MSTARRLREFAQEVRGIARRVDAMEGHISSHRTVFAVSSLQRAADELSEIAKECAQ